jgi:hypothetical protein
MLNGSPPSMADTLRAKGLRVSLHWSRPCAPALTREGQGYQRKFRDLGHRKACAGGTREARLALPQVGRHRFDLQHWYGDAHARGWDRDAPRTLQQLIRGAVRGHCWAVGPHPGGSRLGNWLDPAQQGQLRAVAVSTAARSSLLTAVPAMRKVGYDVTSNSRTASMSAAASPPRPCSASPTNCGRQLITPTCGRDSGPAGRGRARASALISRPST